MERKAVFQDRPACGDAPRLPPAVGKMPFPVSPIIHSALRAIYAGGPKSRWLSDAHGHPYYPYETRAGTIVFFHEQPPDYSQRFHPTIALYYTPRLDFIYSGRLRDTVRSLSVESADVLMILMSAIARLDDPRTGIARITPEEIAAMRNIRLRRGRSRNLIEDLKAEVLRLGDLRLFMTWKDYRTGGTVAFGRERPDRLLDLLDVEYRRRDRGGTVFRYRCGQALSHFLDVEGLFWIGYYGRALLHLNPYQEAFTKKLGTYWTLIGTVAGKKGELPRATPRSILDFCGESVNRRNPGHMVDAFFKAHERLMEIGIIESDDLREPVSRTKGYMVEWLETPVTVKLSEKLWKRARRIPARRQVLLPAPGAKRRRPSRTAGIPGETDQLAARPQLVKELRARFHLRQADLAKELGVTRQTLSRYERGLSRIPEPHSETIITVFRRISARHEEH
ncbi:MAG: helix-turn-helix transcriptional regulator [Syntrophales bacterium]